MWPNQTQILLKHKLVVPSNPRQIIIEVEARHPLIPAEAQALAAWLRANYPEHMGGGQRG